MSEWKPGAVGRIHARGEDALVVRLQDEWRAVHSGKRLNPYLVPRPLAVSDPEDREQVERLIDLYCGGQWGNGWDSEQVDKMQAALREYAKPTPPKPERPTGLGAVVRDSTDVEFVHLGSDLWTYGTTDGPASSFTWDELDAVEVLSQGWSE